MSQTTDREPAAAADGRAREAGGAGGGLTALLEVQGLCVDFQVSGGWRAPRRVRVVEDVSLRIDRGATLGLVGESGSGKTTLSRAILRLIPAAGGSVRFDGGELLKLSGRQMQPLRRRMQIVFQDPAGSLNPRLRVEWIVGEALHVHGLARTAAQRRERVATALQRVGLPTDAMQRYPHEFSGGQRQRIGIARALALEPDLVICDEPVSALDVSIQSQILNLLARLQQELKLTYLFVAHNLAVVRQFCDEIAVMQRGRIVEQGTAAQILESPRHAYTQALLEAAPGERRIAKTEQGRAKGEPARF